jgi:adenosylcobinamide kinase / adenosylcobinamide-phosphate guanylyltransferase
VTTLVLGGVRSGKSRYAEQIAQRSSIPVSLIVTGAAGDAEMAARIAAHRARRPAHWQVVEAPLQLGRAITRASAPDRLLIVDCLTLWLSNLLALADVARLHEEREALLAAAAHPSGSLLLVSNEVGLGIVPVNELARRFADEAGVLHQQLAEACEQVVWMVAGIPLVVKGPGQTSGAGT